MTKETKAEAVTIYIGNINDGAAIDAFDLELRKVMENIADLATVATATRSVTLKFDFKPNADRCKVETEFSIKTSLAGIEKHKSKMFIARTESNAFVALDEDPRQMPLWEAPKREAAPVLKFAAGEEK